MSIIAHKLNLQTASRKELLDEIARLEDALAELASELYWTQGILANPAIQGNAKSVLIATHQTIGKSIATGKPQEKGKVRAYRADVAKRAGCSEQTVSATWKKLAESGLLEKEISHKKTESGFDKASLIEIPEQVYINPRNVAMEASPAHGGKRIPECVHCHSTDHIRTLKKVSYMCTNPDCPACGVEVDEHEIAMVSGDLLEREEAEAEAEGFYTLDQFEVA